ncbi:MAG: hypothetical protein IPP40_16080 [bacterium]|nr:hypothetical protein [bacterium]
MSLRISANACGISRCRASGGMVLSVGGMAFLRLDILPVAGAIGQEIIDVVAVLTIARAAWPPKELTDI